MSNPMIEAVRNNNIELVKKLSKKKGRLNIYDYCSGYTPLMIACDRGYLEIAKILIRKGADVNAREKKCVGFTPLMFACDAGDLEMVKLLIDNGANINDKISPKWNVLSIACDTNDSQHMEVSKYLDSKLGFFV